MPNKAANLAIISALALLVYATGASADLSPIDPTTGKGVLDTALDTFTAMAIEWEPRIRPAAEYLFWALVAIGMIFRFSPLVFKQADIGEYFSELTNGPEIARDIIRSLMTLGSEAIGSDPATPSSIVNVGFMIFKRAVAFLGEHPIDGILGVVVSVIILLIMTAIAVNVLLTLVMATFISYAGFIMLAFGGAEWTRDIAWRYVRRAGNVGLQLFYMTLLVGAGNAFLTRFYNQMGVEGLKLEELGVMLSIIHLISSLYCVN